MNDDMFDFKSFFVGVIVGLMMSVVIWIPFDIAYQDLKVEVRQYQCVVNTILTLNECKELIK